MTDEEFQALLARVDIYREAVRLKGGVVCKVSEIDCETTEGRP